MSKQNQPLKPAAGNRRVEQGAQSRARLIASARALFEREGYAATSTEALLAATGLTRGALYHHFRDKKDVFVAVCEAVHQDLSAAIDGAVQDIADPFEQLVAGALAWIDAISCPGPCQVLLIDGPSVLGAAQWAALDDRYGYRQLRAVVGEVLTAMVPQGEGLSVLQVDVTAAALNGAVNELALWLARQASQGDASARQQARNAAQLALRRLCATLRLPPT
ncbi:TetR/AcrR family transcriptional regulator [Chitiniphilus purpureus]|uniref:TetR/AcrR family transcriptional regulator n=1 Tax=Chitiniphilus purpureus TaxID=2981137 RepID=A0ABY6DP28_9NEIS|nr:TetR/AcrR family transcriptional regulator [Chitiniphilus sp. CD1]UXY15428.1 TetR/AcrR family transcriptional regulator [Chitiniphilus sp. CD1]